MAMADNKFCGNQKELVCIEANRVLDSCRDRDCYENIKVYLTDFGQEIIEHTGNVRVKNAYIAWTYIDITPVQFNRGFYSVNIRFYICCEFEACVGGRSQEFDGVTAVEKKVILFGSESNVNIYKSDSEFSCSKEPSTHTKNVPVAVVEAVDPVVLDARIVEERECGCCGCCCCAEEIPEKVTCNLSGALAKGNRERSLLISFGIFSVVRIVRPAQYLINASEYSVPDKECISSEEKSPCSLFRNMAFPTQEFSLPAFTPERTDKHCGC